MDSLWLAITNLGRDKVFIVVLALYAWLVNPFAGRNLGIVFTLSYLVNTALKYGLNVPRIFADNPGVASEAAKATAGGPSLPSGHAQMAATLWGGIAAQVNRPWMWVVGIGLALLIGFSRLALNVHYPVDVVVGLLLGTVFALWAARADFPQHDLARWVPPLILLVVAAFLPSYAPHELGTGLGLLVGFWVARPNFRVPGDWSGRLIVGLLGLLIVFAVFFGLGALPAELKNIGLVRALRYALLVWVAVEGVPALLRRWLPTLN